MRITLYKQVPVQSVLSVPMDLLYSDRVVLADWRLIMDMQQFCGDFRSKMPLEAVAW